MMAASLPASLFGRIDAQSFAFHRAWQSPTPSELIGAGAALVAILGSVAALGWVTRNRAWGDLWRNWFTSVDAKRIGIMYIVLAFVMMARGIAEGAIMRSQQAVAINARGYLAPDHFAELFTTHGTIMIFFVGMPFLTGLINYVVPLQIGARDVAFPRLNAISFWLTAAGAVLVMASLVVGQFSTGGWTGYPPYTGIEYSPGVGVDYWIWSLAPASVATTLSGINFAVTIYKKRTPSMGLMQMPMFTWTALCTSIIMIYALPALTVAAGMLALDRYLDFHYFTTERGGNMMNYVNIIWMFGHPEVYLLVLPAYGVYSTLFSTFSAKKLFGYRSLVYASIAIAVLSFLVWLHHFFTMGQSADVNAIFGIATMFIGIPTGVKVYDWLLTMYGGRIRITSHLIWAIGFLILFVIGGLTGILLAAPPIDFQVHNTVFLVAHFHNMLVPAMLFGLFAGYQYWFPKAFGFRLQEGWGKITAVCFIVGFSLAFLPLYAAGLEGMPRRSAFVTEEAWRPWLLLAATGPIFLVAGYASWVFQLWSSVRNRAQLGVPVGDPWDGRDLEWSVSAPPPEYNFAVIPKLSGPDAFWTAKQRGLAYAQPDAYEDIVVPMNTPFPLAIGAIVGLLCFGLIFHIWWMAAVATFAGLAATIAWTFGPERERIIPAATVATEHREWLALVSRTRAVGRDEEFSTTNRGLADCGQ